MIKAVDLSNYTTNVPVPNSGAMGGLITDQNCQDLIQAGFTHAIIGTQWPLVAQSQLEVCTRNGMTVDIYSWLGWARDIPSYIADRLHFKADFPQIGTHWLDAEEDPAGLNPQQIIAKIQQGVDAVTNSEVGIYTGKWWWQPITGDTNQFSNLPLWHAGYTYPALPSYSDFQSYGGWAGPTLWQYGGSVQLLGMNLDLNIGKDIETHPPVRTWVYGDESAGLEKVGNQLYEWHNGVTINIIGDQSGLLVGKRFHNEGGTFVELEP